MGRRYASRLPTRPPPRVLDPLLNNPRAAYQELPGDLTFIRRPPPSAASPESFTTAPSSPLVTGDVRENDPTKLPPVVSEKKAPAQGRMSDEDIARMRELRAKDPVQWTAGRLAKEFGCSPWFVGQITSLKGPERRKALEERDREHATNREKWGERRSMNAELRKRRKEFW